MTFGRKLALIGDLTRSQRFPSGWKTLAIVCTSLEPADVVWVRGLAQRTRKAECPWLLCGSLIKKRLRGVHL